MNESVFRRVTNRTHVGLLLAALALLAFGTVMVWSATLGMTAHDSMFRRHLLGVALGILPLAVLWLLDYQTLKAWTGPLTIGLALLIISPRIPGLGATAKGATSWLEVFGMRLFQPSEPAKVLFIVVLAALISEFEGKIDTPRKAARVAAYAAVPLVLILLQPDLGTGLVFVAITVAMLLVGGMKGRYFAVFGVVLVLAAGVAISTPILKTYQRNRLLVFIDPTLDPRDAGYNLAQSKIAIGSGGLAGKGVGSGTQSNLNFLPERHTDFIFSVLGEQTGFLGAILLLGAFLALLSAALSVATSSRDLFGALVASGMIGMWLFQVLENVGMTIGLMPITGIPLPFMSYGASAMVTNLAGVGMLLSIWSRRYGTQRGT